MSDITLRPGAKPGTRKPRLHAVLESVVQDKAQFELLLTLVSAFVSDDTKPASQRQLLNSKLQSIRSLYDAAHGKLGLVVYNPPAPPPHEHDEHDEHGEYSEIILQISYADSDVHGKKNFLPVWPFVAALFTFCPPLSLQAMKCCSSPTAMTTTAVLTLQNAIQPAQKQRAQAIQAGPSPIQTETKTTKTAFSIKTFATKT